MAKRKKAASKVAWLIPLLAVMLIGSLATLYFTDVISFSSRHSLVLLPMNGDEQVSYKVVSGETSLLPVPERDGYNFLGWYQIANPLDVLVTDETKIEADMTLYAKWEIGTYDLNLYDFATVFFTSVSTGSMHSLALSSEGRVFAWGLNNSGQLGNGTNLDKTTPFDITSMFNFATDEEAIQISSGQYHSIVLSSKGRVFTFGTNANGQLGNETFVSSNSPIDITAKFVLQADETIEHVQSGLNYNAALSSKGRVFTWGENSYGQLGNGNLLSANTPTDITGSFSLAANETITKLITGAYSQFAYTSSARIFAWGQNYSNNLGDGTTSNRLSPYDVSTTWQLQAGENVVTIASGFASTYVVTSLNRLLTWGLNDSGQLGNGTLSASTVPTDIMNKITWQEGETVLKVFARGFSTFILTNQGRVFGFGNNSFYQLGDGTSNYKVTPYHLTAQFNLSEGETIVQIDSLAAHTLAVTSLGRIFAWGYNQAGQSGIGTLTMSTPSPTAHETIVDVYHFAVNETLPIQFNDEIIIDEPTKFGFTFGGWFTDEELSTAFDLLTMPGRHLHLYPKWNPVF